MTESTFPGPGNFAGGGGALRSLRQRNRELLVSLLRERGTGHRAELARLAGLSRSTVTTIVAELIEEGIVVEYRSGKEGKSKGGRGGEVLTLNVSAGAALGVDYSLGGVRAVVANLAHEVLAEAVVDLAPDAEWPERLEAGLSAVGQILDRAGIPLARVLGLGLGIPDPLDLLTGTAGRSRSGPTWTGVRAADRFADRLGVPVALDNTAHLAALAEVMWGAGVGVRNAVYLKMSYGIGAGLLIDGRIFRGAIGAAGELGHISVSENGAACPCGNRGCLELSAGTPAILSALRPLRGADLTLEEVLEAAQDGDRACHRVIEDAGRATGRVLAGVCNLLNPELVIVGGDLASAGDILLDPMREVVSRSALSLVSSSVKIVPAALGREAGVLGGVGLILREADQLGATYRAIPERAAKTNT